MKPTFIFLAAIFMYMNSFGQNEIKIDSTKAIKKSAFGKFGFYIEPLYASGKLTGMIPFGHQYDGLWGETITYYNPKPKEFTFGYATGFEVRILHFHNFSFNSGVSLQYLTYSGKSASRFTYDNGDTVIVYSECNDCYPFFYKDLFLFFPVNIQYNFLKNQNSACYLDFGANLSFLLNEKYTGDEYDNIEPGPGRNMFGFGGIGFNTFISFKTIFSIEPVFKYELYKKKNVQYYSIGLKTGLMFN